MLGASSKVLGVGRTCLPIVDADGLDFLASNFQTEWPSSFVYWDRLFLPTPSKRKNTF